MGKTRDLFKKIRDNKRTFREKMDTRDRSGMDLTEAEHLTRGGKNTQNCTGKVLMTQVTMMV